MLTKSEDADKDVVEATYALSTALREVRPRRAPNAVDAPTSTRTLFAWLASGVMLVVVAPWLLGVIR